MLHRVALVRTDVSVELSASFIRVSRIGELGTALAVTNNRCNRRTGYFLGLFQSPQLPQHSLKVLLIQPLLHRNPTCLLGYIRNCEQNF
jgi:hypothetical protein